MKRKVRKAVFPAAGLGTRFLPATKAQPKEMLPLVDKPLIQYVIEEAVDSGIESVIIITGRGKNAIEDHFDVSYELENLLSEQGKQALLETVQKVSNLAHISYVRQKKALGLGHAVLMARELVGDEPFAVMLGDDIIHAQTPCLRQMLDVYEAYSAPIVAIEEIPLESISQYGVISGKPVDYNGTRDRLYKLDGLVEKPPKEAAPSNLAIIGRYILEPEIFEVLAATQAGAGGEIQLTDGLRTLLQQKGIYGWRFEGKRYDTGNKLGFLEATVDFALRRPDLGDAFRKYLKSLRLE
ncbi:MAG: UTP--glucose-1-phosphate uridylyltransferase GalU [Acidobacteria bacterium]|nr:UTP--glucose-1-phosphate uridylyltransferase GalU [Acidobacteriota bacterium]